MLTSTIQSFSHLIYPSFCLHCEKPLEESSKIFCSACFSHLALINPLERCSFCFSEKQNQKIRCKECYDRGLGVFGVASAFDYGGPAETLVKRFKYSGKGYLAKSAGGFLLAQFSQLEWPIPDIIIPVPLSISHFMIRRYNQSFLLAQELGKFLERPVQNILKRREGDYSQARLSKKERRQLSEDSIYLKSKKSSSLLKRKTILLVDDVLTTGTTIKRCAEAIFEGDPAVIYAITLCRTIG